MAYRLRKKDPSVEAAVRRIAGELVTDAIGHIEQAGADPARIAAATHAARKTCKKMRALVRLVRSAFPDYALENAAFRQIAQGLSSARDAKVLLDSFDLLTGSEGSHASASPLAGLRATLEADGAVRSGCGDEADALYHARAHFLAAGSRIGDWTLHADGWDALGEGVALVLGRARKAWQGAHASSDPAAWHELRKPLKYHWYHTRLLVQIWHGPMQARAASLSQVADLIGLDHDMSVLEARLRDLRGHGADPAAVDIMFGLARRKRAQLERLAHPEIARLLVRGPAGLARDWGALWAIWHGRR